MKVKNSVATQTDELNNQEKGRQRLDSKQQHNQFYTTEYDNSPLYFKNVYKVFAENFIAEETISDPKAEICSQLMKTRIRAL